MIEGKRSERFPGLDVINVVLIDSNLSYFYCLWDYIPDIRCADGVTNFSDWSR